MLAACGSVRPAHFDGAAVRELLHEQEKLLIIIGHKLRGFMTRAELLSMTLRGFADFMAAFNETMITSEAEIE